MSANAKCGTHDWVSALFGLGMGFRKDSIRLDYRFAYRASDFGICQVAEQSAQAAGSQMIDRIFEYIVGGGIAFVLVLLARLRLAQGKLGKLEQKEENAKIVDDVKAESDSSLDSELSNDIESGNPKT